MAGPAPVILDASAPTDEALVRAIERGEKRAMRVLFARHGGRVYRFMARLLGDTGPAEDLVGDVFLAVWRKAYRLGKRSRVLAWLLGIARDMVSSYLGRRGIGDLDEAAYANNDPCGDLQENSRDGLFRKALTLLSPVHREIIDLTYYHKRSVAEVSTILRIPETSVRLRMSRARKRLADILGAADRVRMFAALPIASPRLAVSQHA